MSTNAMTAIQSAIVGRSILKIKTLLGERGLFSDLAKLGKAPTRRSPPARRILIYAYKWWPAHQALESLLGRALQLRGAEVSFFLCGFPQEACDNFRMDSNRFLTCAQCLYSGEHFINQAGFPIYRLSDYRRAEDEDVLRQLPFFSNDKALRAYEWNGIRVGMAAEASALRQLRINSLDSERPHSYRLAHQFLELAVRTYLATDRLFEEQKFDMILVQGGKAASESSLLENAIKRRIPFMTYDFGATLGNVMFRLNASISDASIAPVWNYLGDRNLTAEELQRVDTYMEDRRYGKFSIINTWPDPQFSEHPIDTEGVHKRGGRVYMLFTNVAWDTACSGSQAAFESMFSWLENTIAFFLDRPRDFLLIRIHPAEVQMTRGTARDRVDAFIRSRFPDLPSNIRVILPEDQMSTYSLLPHADVVLVYTTTVGMEAATMGKPVITGGKAYYGGYGFETQATNVEHYRQMLADPNLIASGRKKEEIQHLAKKWMHCYFHRLNIPFPLIQLEGPKFLPRLTINGPEDLAPGRNAELDQICDGLLNAKEIFVGAPSLS